MKCPNCGHENPDIRLFCARCGEILPEKEEIEPKGPEDNAREADKLPETVPDIFDDVDFYRRRERARRVYEDAWPETVPGEEEKKVPSIFDGEDADEPEKAAAPTQRPSYGFATRPETYIPRREEEINPDSLFEVDDKPHAVGANRAPELSGKGAVPTSRPETFIPQRDDSLDPDNFFDVRGRSASFDRAVSSGKKRRLRQGDEFEDSDRQSFAVRHMRGIVTFALLLFTVAIVVIWAITPAAQRTLAKLDLAWDASAYEELADEAKAKQDYSTAAHYYTIALEKDPGNSAYAHNAADSWLCAENYDMAAKALRKCIEVMPNTAEYYIRLMEIYDGYDNLPDSDRLLVDEGYRRTGDSRLDYKTLED